MAVRPIRFARYGLSNVPPRTNGRASESRRTVSTCAVEAEAAAMTASPAYMNALMQTPLRRSRSRRAAHVRGNAATVVRQGRVAPRRCDRTSSRGTDKRGVRCEAPPCSRDACKPVTQPRIGCRLARARTPGRALLSAEYERSHAARRALDDRRVTVELRR